MQKSPGHRKALTGLLTGRTNPWTTLASGLAVVAGRLDVAQGSKILINCMERTNYPVVREPLVHPIADRCKTGGAGQRLSDSWRSRLSKLKYSNQTLFPSGINLIFLIDLADQVKRLPPAEAAKVCATVARLLAGRPGQGDGYRHTKVFVVGFDNSRKPDGPGRSPKVCAPVARSLAAALEKETDAAARRSLSLGLTTVASRMDPAEAAKVCAPVARSLAAALEKETDAAARRSLSLGLTTVASRMDPAEAAEVCGHASRVLIAALEKEKDQDACGSIIYGLSSLSVRLTDEEAGKVVRLIASTMQDTFVYNNNGNDALFELLTTSMDPADAGRVAHMLVAALGEETDANARWWLAAGLALGAAEMESKEEPGFAGLFSRNSFVRLPGRYIVVCSTATITSISTDGLKVASAGVDQPGRSGRVSLAML